MKKLINKPDRVAAEAVEGLALAFPQWVRKIDGLQALVRRDAPVSGKVAIVIGGGSGHEPLFSGYVGPGMADAAVAGNIFVSPPPEPIFQAAKAVHGGRGVLFAYANYSGDVLNFDMAADMCREGDIPVVSVRCADDVASAPPDRKEERRGIAGTVFVIKVAAAMAEERAGLREVADVARKASENTRSMGIALSSCIIPASGRPIFEISGEEMEIGMGLHGEPGVQRGPMVSADELASNLVGRLLADQVAKSGHEVAVMVNGYGATPLGELLIMFRAVSRILKQAEISICGAYVGNYATSLEMAGCSVSLIRLDAELKRLLFAPGKSSGLTQV